MAPYQVAAGLFVRLVQVDDGLRDVSSGFGGLLLGAQPRFQMSNDQIAKGLSFREQPGLERGIAVLDLGEEVIDLVGLLQQARVRGALGGVLDDIDDVDADLRAIKRNSELVGTKSGKAARRERIADLMERLSK